MINLDNLIWRNDKGWYKGADGAGAGDRYPIRQRIAIAVRPHLKVLKDL